jgi:hypothetical protein
MRGALFSFAQVIFDGVDVQRIWRINLAKVWWLESGGWSLVAGHIAPTHGTSQPATFSALF